MLTKKELDNLLDDLIVKYATAENFRKAEACFRERRSMRCEEARGGLLISRGYYSRAILEEIVVTNVRRGRLLTRKARKKADYEFYFDDEDTLVIAVRNFEDIDGCEYEWIFKEDDREISITLGDDWQRDDTFSITVTEWEDGKQKRYIHAYYSFYLRYSFCDMFLLLEKVREKAAEHQLDYDRAGLIKLEMEEYEYEGGRMTQGRQYNFDAGYLDWVDITFCYDKDGVLLHCLTDSDSISFHERNFKIDWNLVDCPWMHEEEDPRVKIPEHIKAMITGCAVPAPDASFTAEAFSDKGSQERNR